VHEVIEHAVELAEQRIRGGIGHALDRNVPDEQIVLLGIRGERTDESQRPRLLAVDHGATTVGELGTDPGEGVAADGVDELIQGLVVAGRNHADEVRVAVSKAVESFVPNGVVERIGDRVAHDPVGAAEQVFHRNSITCLVLSISLDVAVSAVCREAADGEHLGRKLIGGVGVRLQLVQDLVDPLELSRLGGTRQTEHHVPLFSGGGIDAHLVEDLGTVLLHHAPDDEENLVLGRDDGLGDQTTERSPLHEQRSRAAPVLQHLGIQDAGVVAELAVAHDEDFGDDLGDVEGLVAGVVAVEDLDRVVERPDLVGDSGAVRRRSHVEESVVAAGLLGAADELEPADVLGHRDE